VLKWLGAPFHERAYDTEMDSASAAEDSWRVAMSALLDGEEPPVPVADLMQHLSECASCSAWLDNAMVVNQGMRSLPVHHRDLGEMVVNSADVAHLPERRPDDQLVRVPLASSSQTWMPGPVQVATDRRAIRTLRGQLRFAVRPARSP
jgi:hypothetical protein